MLEASQESKLALNEVEVAGAAIHLFHKVYLCALLAFWRLSPLPGFSNQF